MLYTYKNKWDSTIEINYSNKIEEVIDLAVLESFYKDMQNQLGLYYGNFFSGLKMEIWDDILPSIPKNQYAYNEKDRAYTLKVMGIANYSGLTWSSNSLIQLNDNLFNQPENMRKIHMSNLFSHEVGHWIAFKVLDFNNDSTIFKQRWKKIRGIHANSATPEGELIAEDMRILFGSNLAKSFERGAYIQATKIAGLSDFYRIWKIAEDYMKEIKKVATIKNPTFNNDSSEFYFEVDMNNWLAKPFNKKVKVCRNGIYSKFFFNSDYNMQELYINKSDVRF